MREIAYEDIVNAVKNLVIHTATNLPEDALNKLKEAHEKEASPVAKKVLEQLLENADIARSEKRPLCQDTGLAVYFVKVGQDVKITGGLLKDAINEGTEKGYIEGYLRASTCDCFTRENLKEKIGYNLPAIIHIDLVEGDKIEIEYAAKGGGSENVSRARVLAPAQGKEGVIEFVKSVISEAGPNPCPPIIVGVGIGGTFEKAAISSKYALFREAGKPHSDPEVAEFEKELLHELNKLGIGAMGMGGTQTVLAVHVEKNPCHIASLPVSVNVQCHSSRHSHITL
ncbi:fumarate hydratase [Hydrogenimonas thermophila]|uniref:Fumarate hydratase subunit alpha n=1 Tax=Hydrogenimonas thermophila TaxID=223786 RepID=A0A1I5QGU4_9BACT|nr:fumarate hydratase [Hydrogenimonas thermophila]WOE68878.1 fumarate hydratase [Hydrogenimonas thermophila]WOE71386.1 fumarate hydratase [Hydrogenimonas thermophila]SFP45463.1 fumarate hydratase subunit alpha [Hydrogenimonas thermophila]